jgi:hypothetical protein
MAQPHADAFIEALPRYDGEGGGNLNIVHVDPNGEVTITDGTRTAIYAPIAGQSWLNPGDLHLTNQIEAGWFREVQAIVLADGKRKAVYEAIKPR